MGYGEKVDFGLQLIESISLAEYTQCEKLSNEKAKLGAFLYKCKLCGKAGSSNSDPIRWDNVVRHSLTHLEEMGMFELACKVQKELSFADRSFQMPPVRTGDVVTTPRPGFLRPHTRLGM